MSEDGEPSDERGGDEGGPCTFDGGGDPPSGCCSLAVAGSSGMGGERAILDCTTPTRPLQAAPRWLFKVLSTVCRSSCLVSPVLPSPRLMTDPETWRSRFKGQRANVFSQRKREEEWLHGTSNHLIATHTKKYYNGIGSAVTCVADGILGGGVSGVGANPLACGSSSPMISK